MESSPVRILIVEANTMIAQSLSLAISKYYQIDKQHMRVLLREDFADGEDIYSYLFENAHNWKIVLRTSPINTPEGGDYYNIVRMLSAIFENGRRNHTYLKPLLISFGSLEQVKSHTKYSPSLEDEELYYWRRLPIALDEMADFIEQEPNTF